ncbi:MAG: hypothetical protein JWQ71_785 [Pedosphaera sp.]|nr:hypothetical protein [Pedosphaera sp.]
MSDLNISFHEPRMIFRPGESLKGRAIWHLDKPARAVELRLIWFTLGQVTSEAKIIKTLSFSKPLQDEARDFEFLLPQGPYSYAGTYTVLNWGLEMVVLPSKEHKLRTFELSPSDAGALLL